MSGLEPLVALGLACNILQIVQLGYQTIECIKAVYQGKPPNQGLDENAAALENLSVEVKTHTRPGNNNYEEGLLKSAGKCCTAAQALRKEVRIARGSNAKQGSLVSALKVVSKATWRKRRLEKLKGDLEQAEKQIQTSLLAQIW